MKTATLLLLLLTAAAPAHGDGCFFGPDAKRDLREPEQIAWIAHRDGIEDLVLHVRFDGAPDRFAWVVPLPAIPESSPADPKLFEELSARTRFERTGKSEEAQFIIDHALILEGAGPAGPRVVRREAVGIYDTAVLRGGSGEGIASWLTENGFHIPGGAEAVLEEYAEMGWVFVAMRVDPSRRIQQYPFVPFPPARPPSGSLRSTNWIHPIRFRFPVDEPVYPLRITSITGHESEILLYVAAPDQLVPRDDPETPWETRIHGRFADHGEIPLGEDPLFLPGEEPFLSKIRATLDPDQMRDLRFRIYDPAEDLASDDPYRRQTAASNIGWTRNRAFTGELIRLLDPGTDIHVDDRTMIWALGELDAAEAVPLLSAWTDHDCFPCRIEALAALARIDDPRAMIPVVRGLKPRPRPESPWINYGEFGESMIRWQCFRWILERGDEGCIDSLRTIAGEGYGYQAWMIGVGCDPASKSEDQRVFPDLETPAGMAVVALAALDDERAFAAMREGLLREAIANRDSLPVPHSARFTTLTGKYVILYLDGDSLVAEEQERIFSQCGLVDDWELHRREERRWYLFFTARDMMRSKMEAWQALDESVRSDPAFPKESGALLAGYFDKLPEGWF